MATEQENYQKLQAERLRESKKQMRQAQGNAGGKGGSVSKVAGRSNVGKTLNVGREAKLAKELPLAFTAINPSEDAIQLLIIAFSIMGDILTIVPAVGSLLALPFIIMVWFFYLLDGHFKKSAGRKLFTTGIFQSVELVFSTLPALTASALINYWYYLADKKLVAKEGQKKQQQQQQQEINF